MSSIYKSIDPLGRWWTYVHLKRRGVTLLTDTTKDSQKWSPKESWKKKRLIRNISWFTSRFVNLFVKVSRVCVVSPDLLTRQRTLQKWSTKESPKKKRLICNISWFRVVTFGLQALPCKLSWCHKSCSPMVSFETTRVSAQAAELPTLSRVTYLRCVHR